MCCTVDMPWYRSTTTPSMDSRLSLMNAPSFFALGLNAVLSRLPVCPIIYVTMYHGAGTYTAEFAIPLYSRHPNAA